MNFHILLFGIGEWIETNPGAVVLILTLIGGNLAGYARLEYLARTTREDLDAMMEEVKHHTGNGEVHVNQLYMFQQVTQHRNMLGKIVTCCRWFGNSRLDTEWLNSGYASKEAKDKAKGSRLLDELYKARGLTEDVLAAAEEKDKWNPWKDEDEVEDD